MWDFEKNVGRRVGNVGRRVENVGRRVRTSLVSLDQNLASSLAHTQQSHEKILKTSKVTKQISLRKNKFQKEKINHSLSEVLTGQSVGKRD